MGPPTSHGGRSAMAAADVIDLHLRSLLTRASPPPPRKKGVPYRSDLCTPVAAPAGGLAVPAAREFGRYGGRKARLGRTRAIRVRPSKAQHMPNAKLLVLGHARQSLKSRAGPAQLRASPAVSSGWAMRVKA